MATRRQSDGLVGQFKIQLEIGKGSFATVYRAIHVKNRSLVAVKSVQLRKLNKKLKDNLYSEIEILKGLHHPHIVALIDCQESSAHIHLVMEFCQLGDLSYFIRKRERLANHPATAPMVRKYPSPTIGGLNEVTVRHFLKQLASALEFLRAKNFIHRDVKPQNLLLNPSPIFLAKEQGDLIYAASEKSLVPIVGIESLPMLKIADFGFARSLPSTSLAETLCGSPLYMAPEILRYEKYDAKADLWSVGTVLYEMMTGRPPFKAANHVELLRKIERQEDRIDFPEGLVMSRHLDRLIRSLLKRNPVERIGFKDFFDHPVINEQIPGLVEEDRPPEPRTEHVSHPTTTIKPAETPLRQVETIPPKRPSAVSHATAPARHDLHQDKPPNPAATAMERQTSRNSNSPGSSFLVQRQRERDQRGDDPHLKDIRERESQRGNESRRDGQRGDDPQVRDVRERAEQEVAFERDYVVVEKRAVEVNAFADELAASPHITSGQQGPSSHQQPQSHQHLHQGALTRRATTQGPPTSTTGAQVTSSRAMQIVSAKQRPDAPHQRRSSYERKYSASPGSAATSAITKALNMANFRLFGMGLSPPRLGRAGDSPPQGYGAFPTSSAAAAAAAAAGSIVMIGDGSRTIRPGNDDAKAVHTIEELATRSDVVYGFAEIKFKQLIPLAPGEHGLGFKAGDEGQDSAGTGTDDGLTLDAVVTLSEEALVLYVKALSLLAKALEVARVWWMSRNKAGSANDEGNGRGGADVTTLTAGTRINNVVQWMRARFNEVLEKAEFVTLKLSTAQHLSSTGSQSPGASGPSSGQRSVESVSVRSGVTAEKLMYERALEMSRTAAVNELVGEDLPGCEIAYATAVRMLEAVLEEDSERSERVEPIVERSGRCDETQEEREAMQVEDRQVIEKLVASMRARLVALRKKMNLVARRSVSQPSGLGAPAATAGSTAMVKQRSQRVDPALATTPPR